MSSRAGSQSWQTTDAAYTAEGLWQGPSFRRRRAAEEQQEGDGQDPERLTNDDEELYQAAIEQLNVR